MKNRFSRRTFVRLGSAAAALTAVPSFAAASRKLTFSFSHKPVATMPLDFTGLSYESPQLANPDFFSPKNTGLVKLFRDLSPHGVLRTGGNLSAFTGWRDDPSVPITPPEQAFIDKGKGYWEWALCDPTIARGNHEAVFTPASIKTLAAFLDATGWKLIYGLNFGYGTPEQAAAEAACVQKLVGKNLVAFQLGNEIDFWVGGARPKDWDFDRFFAQWSEWTKIIRTKAPNAPFGGPDVAIRLDWVERLADRMQGDLALLSKHHYAMGPAGDPTMTGQHLLGPDPDIAKEIASAQHAKAVAGVGFRNTETNTCFHGGQPGVSDAYASALWCADYMLTLAQGGHAGVNLHGGGDGFYSPIVGDAQRGITPRPIYFGMQFAQMFAGSTFMEGSLASPDANATAYTARTADGLLVALINKSSDPADFELDAKSLGARKAKQLWKLSAPALDSREGVTFAPSARPGGSSRNLYQLAPYTAILIKFS